MNPDLATLSNPQRLASLRQTQLMDTPAEESFDRITRLTAKLLGVPIALISLVDADRQFFKSQFGLPEALSDRRHTPLTHSFCKNVVETGTMLVINDARNDPALRDSFATRNLQLVAYLGAPLTGPGGQIIGVLCAVDHVPRQWTPELVAMLGDLAAFVVAEIGSHRASSVERSAEAAVQQALEQLRLKEAESRFNAELAFLADAMPQIVWTSAPDGTVEYYNQRWFDYTGLTVAQSRNLGWEFVMHPDDIAQVMEKWAVCVIDGSPYEAEFRFRRGSDGACRWHLARSVAMRDAHGKIVRWVGTSTDIHDQKMTSAALTEARDQLEQRVRDRTAQILQQQQFLQAVLDSITDGIIACDSTGKVSVLNRTMRELHGGDDRSMTPDELARRHSLFAPDGSPILRDDDLPLRRAFAGQVVKDQELLIGLANSTTKRRILANGRLIVDADGNRLGAVVAAHDITERAAAENKFRILFESSADAYLLGDDSGILDCNNAAIKMLGCRNKDELLSRQPSSFSPEFQPCGRRSAEMRIEINNAVERFGTHRFEWIHRRIDGTDVAVEVILTAVELGGNKAVLTVWHDLTERKEAEAEIERQKQFIEAVIENASDGIIACDQNGRITCMNRAIRTMQGVETLPLHPAHEWFVTNFSLYDPTTGRRLEWEERPLVQALRNELVDGVELIVKPVGRPEVTVLMSASPIMGKAGEIIGAVCAYHDVTDLRRSEKELITAKETADAANLAKSEFLANMSHEIRTPMTAILGYTELLDDPMLSAKQRRGHASVVRRNGQHLLQLLSDILDLSKIEAGEMTLEQLEFNPNEMLSEIESLLRPHASGKRISLTTAANDRFPDRIITDPTRLKQILLNLVGNAVKFTQHGGVKVTAGVDPADSSDRIWFEVSDTGIGITPAQMATLFHPFRQADGSTTRRFGGTGLGLAICKRLAQMLDGELTVTSEAGVGSIFKLVLPVRLPTANAIAPAATIPTPAIKSAEAIRLSGKILLAEDGIDNQRLARLYLETAGLSVSTAINGRIAVESVIQADRAGKPFDVVLMDMQMPELDGYGATAQLRQAGYTQLPIIAFTAHALSSERKTCLRSGCDDYISKPIDRNNLIQVLAKYLPSTQGEASATLHSEKAEDPLISTVLKDYIKGLPEQIGKMNQHLSRADFRALRLIVHQLKGSGGSYGFPEISTRARDAEAAISGKEPADRIAHEVQSLVDLIRRVEGYDRSKEAPAPPAGLAASAASVADRPSPA